MSARKLIYELMLLAPVLLLLGIGVQSRTYNDPFEPDMMSPTEQARVEAYIPYVNSATSCLDGVPEFEKVNALRREALKWIGAHERGELRDLIPVAFEDDWSDNAKEEIFEARRVLGRRLLHWAEKNGDHVSIDGFARDAVLVMRLMEVLKYSDPKSAYESAAAQFGLVQKIASRLRTERSKEASTWAPQLQQFLSKQRTFGAVASVARSRYFAYRQKMGLHINPLDSGLETRAPTAELILISKRANLPRDLQHRTAQLEKDPIQQTILDFAKDYQKLMTKDAEQVIAKVLPGK